MTTLELHILPVDHLLKTKEEHKNLKKQGNRGHNKLDNACFQHDIA